MSYDHLISPRYQSIPTVYRPCATRAADLSVFPVNRQQSGVECVYVCVSVCATVWANRLLCLHQRYIPP